MQAAPNNNPNLPTQNPQSPIATCDTESPATTVILHLRHGITSDNRHTSHLEATSASARSASGSGASAAVLVAAALMMSSTFKCHTNGSETQAAPNNNPKPPTQNPQSPIATCDTASPATTVILHILRQHQHLLGLQLQQYTCTELRAAGNDNISATVGGGIDAPANVSNE